MAKVILCKKSEADKIRAACATMEEEDGGALFGIGDEGDVVAELRAPEGARRSSVMIQLRGKDFEERAKEVFGEIAGARWVGFWHLHHAMPWLSLGDHRMLDGLHRRGNCPPGGIVKILAVKWESRLVDLLGFISSGPGVVERAVICEVADVVEARAALRGVIPAPHHGLHALGTGVMKKRFEREVGELMVLGYAVAANVVPTGVELILRSGELLGELALTIPAEGWSRPPRVEHRARGSSRLITSALQGFFTGWSSAFTLVDLVNQVRARSAWPKASAGLITECGKKFSEVWS